MTLPKGISMHMFIWIMIDNLNPQINWGNNDFIRFCAEIGKIISVFNITLSSIDNYLMNVSTEIKNKSGNAFEIEKIKNLVGQDQNYVLNKINIQKDTLIIKKISINTLENYTRAYILGKLRFKNGKKISYEDLKTGINNINATQNFNRISYTIENYKDADELKLNLNESTMNKGFGNNKALRRKQSLRRVFFSAKCIFT